MVHIEVTKTYNLTGLTYDELIVLHAAVERYEGWVDPKTNEQRTAASLYVDLTDALQH